MAKGAHLPKKDSDPKSNWVEAAGGLPSYIERIAVHLYEKHGDVGRAIAEAVNTVKRWAKGGTVRPNGGGTVSKETQAKAAKAVAEWEKKKASGNHGQLSDDEFALHLAMEAELAADDEFDMDAYNLALLQARIERELPDVRDLSIPTDCGELNVGRYKLALNEARRERGLNLAIEFDPRKHPRDLKGQFRDVLNSLADGDRVTLPDGTSVMRDGKTFNVSPKGGGAGAANLRDTDAAVNEALGQSAKSKAADSLGGAKSFKDVDEAVRADERKAMEELMAKEDASEMERQKKYAAGDRGPGGTKPAGAAGTEGRGDEPATIYTGGKSGKSQVNYTAGGYSFPPIKVADEDEAKRIAKALNEDPELKKLADAHEKAAKERGDQTSAYKAFNTRKNQIVKEARQPTASSGPRPEENESEYATRVRGGAGPETVKELTEQINALPSLAEIDDPAEYARTQRKLTELRDKIQKRKEYEDRGKSSASEATSKDDVPQPDDEERADGLLPGEEADPDNMPEIPKKSADRQRAKDLTSEEMEPEIDKMTDAEVEALITEMEAEGEDADEDVALDTSRPEDDPEVQAAMKRLVDAGKWTYDDLEMERDTIQRDAARAGVPGAVDPSDPVSTANHADRRAEVRDQIDAVENEDAEIPVGEDGYQIRIEGGQQFTLVDPDGKDVFGSTDPDDVAEQYVEIELGPDPEPAADLSQKMVKAMSTDRVQIEYATEDQVDFSLPGGDDEYREYSLQKVGDSWTLTEIDLDDLRWSDDHIGPDDEPDPIELFSGIKDDAEAFKKLDELLKDRYGS